MEPSSGGQQLILAKVYKWFNGASPYSQYCGGIRKPMCVYCWLYGRRLRLLTEDHRTTLQMIADLLNIGKETGRQIVTEDLGKERSARDLFVMP